MRAAGRIVGDQRQDGRTRQAGCGNDPRHFAVGRRSDDQLAAGRRRRFNTADSAAGCRGGRLKLDLQLPSAKIVERQPGAIGDIRGLSPQRRIRRQQHGERHRPAAIDRIADRRDARVRSGQPVADVRRLAPGKSDTGHQKETASGFAHREPSGFHIDRLSHYHPEQPASPKTICLIAIQRHIKHDMTL